MKKYFLLIIFVLVLYSMAASHYATADVCADGEKQSCGYSDVGECRYGTQLCENGEWSVCLGGKGPESEICDDGKDNDCDGNVDEGCECVSGETIQCGVTDVGVCEYGVEKCINNEWAGCEGAVLPAISDFCDNDLDDDCDGEINEGCLEYPQHCYNAVKDVGEEDIDCGGDCASCVTETCDDGIQNQGEEDIDCGGPCEACPNCFDGIQNGDEIDIDCGGDCSPCVVVEDTDDDSDGVVYKKELLMGTNPNNPDSDFDGVYDGQDLMPLCPNGFCDVKYGENKKNCREDCRPESGAGKYILFLIGVVLFVIIAFFYFRFKKSTKKIELEGKKDFKRFDFDVNKYREMGSGKGKILDNEMEKKLKKSMQKARKLLEK